MSAPEAEMDQAKYGCVREADWHCPVCRECIGSNVSTAELCMYHHWPTCTKRPASLFIIWLAKLFGVNPTLPWPK